MRENSLASGAISDSFYPAWGRISSLLFSYLFTFCSAGVFEAFLRLSRFFIYSFSACLSIPLLMPPYLFSTFYLSLVTVLLLSGYIQNPLLELFLRHGVTARCLLHSFSFAGFSNLLYSTSSWARGKSEYSFAGCGFL